MTATRPFIPRPKDRPAWWAEDAKPEEMEAVVRERTERELRERRARESRGGVRREDESQGDRR